MKERRWNRRDKKRSRRKRKEADTMKKRKPDSYTEAVRMKHWFSFCKGAKDQEFDQVLNDDCSFRQLPKQPLFVFSDARKTLRMAQYARSRVLRNPTVGQLVRYFRRSKGGVGGGRDRGLGGKMALLGPARVLAVEQPTEVESQVAAVVWLAHGGSLTRAAPEHLVDCSPLDTSLFEVANPDSALPGASWASGPAKSEKN